MLTWLLHFNDCLAQVWPRSLLQQYYTRLSLFQAVSRRIAWRCWRKVWLPNFLYETTNLVTTSFMEIHDFQLEMHQLRLFFIPISSSAPMWWWCFSSSFLRGCWAFDVPAHQDITREMESFYVFLKKPLVQQHFDIKFIFLNCTSIWHLDNESSDWNIHGPNVWTTVYQQTSGPPRFGEEIRKIQGVEGFRQNGPLGFWRIDGLWRVINPHLLGGGNSNMFWIFTPKIGEDEPILPHIFQMGWSHQSVIVFKMSSWPLRIVICFSSSSYWNPIQYLSRQFPIYDFPSKLLISIIIHLFLGNLFLSSRNVNLLC